MHRLGNNPNLSHHIKSSQPKPYPNLDPKTNLQIALCHCENWPKYPWSQDMYTYTFFHLIHIYFKSCTVWLAHHSFCHCEDAAAFQWAVCLLIFRADTPANKLVVALPLCLDGLYLPSNTSRFLTLPLLDHLLKLVLVILSASHTAFILIRSVRLLICMEIKLEIYVVKVFNATAYISYVKVQNKIKFIIFLSKIYLCHTVEILCYK